MNEKTGFTNKLNSTITQNGAGVLINYTHGIVKQPDSNTTIKLLFSGKMIQNNVSLSGAHTQKLEGVTSNITDDTYTLTGKPNTEKTILEKMINNPGKVFEREEIGKLIDLDKERSIDVIITRLRKKIEIDPKNPKFLQTIRGAGYVLWIE